MANAKIVNNVVVEILKPIEGFSIEQCFHPLILKDTVYVSDDVQLGWVLQENGTFLDPAIEAEIETELEENSEEPSDLLDQDKLPLDVTDPTQP